MNEYCWSRMGPDAMSQRAEDMDKDDEAERDDEAFQLQRYVDRIDGDWRMDADVRRAEAGYLGGRGR